MIERMAEQLLLPGIDAPPPPPQAPRSRGKARPGRVSEIAGFRQRLGQALADTGSFALIDSHVGEGVHEVLGQWPAIPL